MGVREESEGGGGDKIDLNKKKLRAFHIVTYSERGERWDKNDFMCILIVLLNGFQKYH